MIKFITQEIPFEKSLKQRLEFICQFCKTKPTFINGNIRKIGSIKQKRLPNILILNTPLRYP